MQNHFSFSTVGDFDEHIARSIPGYLDLQELLPSIAKYFVNDNENIYDLGCSTGRLLTALSTYFNESVSFVGYDIEANLLPSLKTAKNVSFFKRDVTDPTLKFINTGLIFSIFTLQFLPTEKRMALVEKVFESLNRGGAFIVAEKTYSTDGIFQDIFTFTNYDYKRKSFSEAEILDKQIDLRKIMRPLSETSLRNELRSVGFGYVSQFWQSLSYRAYIAIKS